MIASLVTAGRVARLKARGDQGLSPGAEAGDHERRRGVLATEPDAIHRSRRAAVVCLPAAQPVKDVLIGPPSSHEPRLEAGLAERCVPAAKAAGDDIPVGAAVPLDRRRREPPLAGPRAQPRQDFLITPCRRSGPIEPRGL